MKDDPLRRDLETELRSMRTKPGSLDLERIAAAEALTNAVGEGSPERAFSALMEMLERHGADPEGDIRAFFETCGVDTLGDNLDHRLDAYHERHSVEKRTGLRRSNRGANKLSYILRDSVNFERPWGNIVVRERDGVAVVSVWVDIPHYAQWRRPHVYINGEFQEDRRFELHDSETEEVFASGKEIFRDIKLLEDVEHEPLEVRVYWSMPVWPVWQIGAHLASPDLYAKLTSERQIGVTVSIERL